MNKEPAWLEHGYDASDLRTKNRGRTKERVRISIGASHLRLNSAFPAPFAREVNDPLNGLFDREVARVYEDCVLCLSQWSDGAA